MVLNPDKISANRTSGILTINWNDGHVSDYPFGLLRAACPCASCRGGHENMSSEPDPEVFFQIMPDSEATHLKSLEGVGSYAISFEWEDGHHFGIYNWAYLRKLCPCAECQPDLYITN